MSEIKAVEYSQKVDGSWQALHVPSGKISHGLTREEAEKQMADLLGLGDEGDFEEPITSDRFEGVSKEIALYLEGPVSNMLAAHAGFARLEAYQDGLATIRLGGGCEGCPSSRLTLANGVLVDLQDKFGEDVIIDVQPVLY